MKRLNMWLLSCLLVFPLQTFAQKDAKAKEILDKSSTAFSNASAISATFTMEVKDISTKTSDIFDGTIELKGARFHVDIPGTEIWFDGKTQWVLQKSWDEVNVSEPTGEQAQALNPSLIYSIYKKGCKYKYLGQKTDEKKRKIHEIELVPEKKGDISKIVLQINATDWMPVKFHLYFTNKIENIIRLNSYQTKQNLADSYFTFNKKKYPNAEIIDLR
ncbi:MAG: outer-membrane lipoprotein carrier protein LolA [Dysgonamonadaceae bacterium]|jgi:outer membrane lipoprotein-sorting protein|nr:outer-membrane lipoprotein carrier protein LolA [Dysgonamonadaceae bacterium]